MDLALSPGISTERPFLMVKKSMPVFQLMKIRSAPSCVNISITPKNPCSPYQGPSSSYGTDYIYMFCVGFLCID